MLARRFGGCVRDERRNVGSSKGVPRYKHTHTHTHMYILAIIIVQ